MGSTNLTSKKMYIKILIFFILFMIIGFLTPFIIAGILLIFKNFNLLPLSNKPLFYLFFLILRYGLTFIIIVWLNHSYMKQMVWFKPRTSFKNQAYPLLFSFVMVLIYIFTVNFKTLKFDVTDVNFFMFSLGSALLEEYGFRGVILPKVIQSAKGNKIRKLMIGILISSTLFGILHGVNIFYQPSLGTLQQMLDAIPFGILMAVLYIRTETILVPMLFHFASDFNAYFTTNSFFTRSFYSGWWGVLIDYGVAFLSILIFLRPTIIDKIKLKIVSKSF